MTMPEMQRAISKLRFLLATLKSKEDELDSLVRQFRRQLERAPNHAIHGGHPLESTLNIMSEIQERLDDAERSRRHLLAIKKRAQDELQALDLTNKVEQAKAKLMTLKRRLNENGEGDAAELEEMIEMERFIEDASIRAGRAITGEVEEDKV